MVLNNKTFRVFVSSTFSDLKEERNALQKYVFPKLRELCMEHGFRFQAIDLRWGVSEEAGLDQRTMKICLEEIERSQKVSPKPNFIVLLGDRYGWRPLPYEIPADEFEDIITHLSEKDKELLLWDESWSEEEFHGYEKGWYRKDENALPAVYCLKPRKVEYDKFDSDDEIKEKKQEESKKWGKIEFRLKKILLKAVEEAKWKKDDKRRFKYETSATEQEIINGALELPEGVPEAKEHVFAFFRNIDNIKQLEEDCKHPLNEIQKDEFDEIKKHLESELVTNYYNLNCEFYVLNLEKIPKEEYDKLENDIFYELQNAARKSHFHENITINDKIKEKYLPTDFIDIIKVKDDIKNTSYNVFDNESHDKLQKLRNRLNKELKENIHTYTANWNQGLTSDHIGVLPKDVIAKSKSNEYIGDPNTLCVAVWNQLYHVVMGEIKKYQEKNPLDCEILDHKKFGKERYEFFVGRDDNRKKIGEYLEKHDSKPFIVYGVSGSGKSAFMAQSVKDFDKDFFKKTKIKKLYYDNIVVRFIGATPESSDMRSLLESLSKQISRIYGDDDSNIPSDDNELIQYFKDRLNLANNEKPLIIFLDALDQLSDSENAHNLSWIPDELSENVHIVISTLKNIFESSLKHTISAENTSEVKKLEKCEGSSILKSWLEESKRELTPEQRKEIINKFEVKGLPLYLKLAFEEVKLWKSYTPVSELKSDIEWMITNLFERLSRPENHGEILVSRSLGYLSAAKNGLTEDEMLDILALDEEVFSLTKKFHDPTEDKLPVAVWSRLYFDLEPYLAEMSADNTSILNFYHRKLGEIAKELYLPKNVKKERHQKIANYFKNQKLFFDMDDKRICNIRKLSELPHQQTYGEQWENLEDTLTDFKFIESKCAQGMLFNLIEDLNNAINEKKIHSLELVRKAVKFNTSTILKNSDLTNQAMYNYLYWSENKGRKLEDKLNEARIELDKKPYWVMAEAPLPEAKTSTSTHINFNRPSSIHSLSLINNLIATSSPDGETEVYSLHTGEKVYEEKFESGKVKSIILGENSNDLAYFTEDGNLFYKNMEIPFFPRKNDKGIVKYVNKGLITVDINNSLIFWDLIQSKFILIDEDVPLPLIKLKVSSDGENVFYVAGIQDQKIVHLKLVNGSWKKEIIEYQGPPIVDIDCDFDSGFILILAIDRCLRLIDLQKNQLTNQINYEHYGKVIIKGRPQKCAISGMDKVAFFVTNKGHVGKWDWENEVLVKLDDVSRPLIKFEFLPSYEKLFFSTPKFGKTLLEMSINEPSLFHEGKVDECLFINSKKVVSMSKMDKTVRCFMFNGLEPLYQVYQDGITTFIPFDNTEDFIIGDLRGNVNIQSTESELNNLDLMSINNLNESVVSIIQNKKAIIVAGEYGRIIKIPVSNGKLELNIKKHKILREAVFRVPIQKKIIKIDEKSFLSFYSYVDGNETIISKIKNKHENIIFNTKNIINDIQFDNGFYNVGVSGNNTLILGKNKNEWKTLFKKNTPTIICSFLNGGLILAVVLMESNWLEFWELKNGLPTVISIELPGKVSCMSNNENQIVLGFQSGKLMSLSLKGTKSM